MSQRNISILSCSSQNKNPLTEFFKGIIREAGIKLSSSDDPNVPNVITQEQALVVRDIDKLLDENYSDDCVEKFLKGFKILIKKERYLRKALSPTLFKKVNDENDVEIQQESLFRIFLKVNHLQKEIIDILLDKITATVSEDTEDTPWLRLLLSQLRYLPHIKNAETLTTKLLDILEIAPFPSQLEILDSIPEILPDSEYSETAKQLAKLLDTGEELSGAIIDCLNALDLDQDIRAHVQDHILSKMLIEPSIKLFPVFLEFLMADYKSQDLPSILLKIRNALDNIMASTDRKENKEKESGKIVIFNRLQSLAAAPKFVSESWLNVIAKIKVHTDHKPIDLLILFMLHSWAKFKKRTVETVFRKRVKDGLFKCSLLEKLFDKYLPQQLLRDYFASMVEIGCGLLRSSNDVAVVDFASTLFRLLFDHDHADVVHRQELLDSLVLLAGGMKNVTAILNVFTSLSEDKNRLRQHAVLLMRLLEKLDSFELKDVRLVFDILCSLTCSEDSLSGLKEELHMIVRKQLGSSKRSVKLRGIVSAVVMAKHIAAAVTEDQSEPQVSEESILSLSHLRGPAKEAAAILELGKTSTADNPELLGLYYDQLASILLETDNLDKYFSTWLYETVTNDFQNVFVTETVCPDKGDLTFSMQYNINSKEEMDAPIAVNIAELTLKSDKSSILVLAPHFRLLRLLHYRHQNGDLSSIDALLGCGVVLPNTEQKDSLDSDQLKQVADCLFHCVNWFRETVSAFVTQKERKLRRKVIQRLDNLIELENLLKDCLDDVPGHVLPASYFDVVGVHKASASPQKESPPTRPRKKLKTKSIVDDTTTVATTSKKPAKKTSSDEIAIKFREMDTDIVKLVKYPLNTTVPAATCSSDQTSLNIDQLNFILGDFATKLSRVLGGHDLGLSHLNVLVPSDLMTDCRLILPSVYKHFAAMIKLLDDEETESTTSVKTGFGLILEILRSIFSWSGFQHSQRLDLLREVLKAFRGDDGPSFNSVNRMIVDLVARLTDHVDHCACLSQAVSLIKIMEALHSISPGPEIRKQIAKTGGKLLSKPWKDGDSARNSAANVDVLIKSYLSNANIKTICGLVGTLQDQAGQLKTRTDSLPMLESVNKANFYIFYRNLWAALHDRVKTEIQSLTNTEHLTLWKTTALTMQGLMTVAKAQESKSNLTCFLKKSVAILKIFLSHGIPMLEIMLRSKPDQVVEIFKTIQSNTRFLHHLCCYSKLTKDAGLMAHVPQFRLTLETLVYRVKAALAANGCSEAFWMGNLKNRDLQGEDILSQSTENTTAEENQDEEEEELPMSDDDDDELDEEEREEGGRRRKSGSDVF